MKHRKTSSCKSNKSNHTTSTDKDVKAADINGMLTPASSNYPPPAANVDSAGRLPHGALLEALVLLLALVAAIHSSSS